MEYHDGFRYDTMRDDSHEYALVTYDMDWTIFDFAQNQNLRIYSNLDAEFLETVTFVLHDNDLAGTTHLMHKTDTLLSAIRWIR